MGLLSVAAFTIIAAFVVSRYLPMFSNFWRNYRSDESPQSAIHQSLNDNEKTKVVEPTNEDAIADQDSETVSTPKAHPTQQSTQVPTLTLVAGDDDVQEGSLPDERSVRKQNVEDVYRKSTMKPPQSSVSPKSAQAVSASSLMPPPARPTTLPNRNPTTSLRVPSTGPLPNRGLPTNSQQRVSSEQDANGAVATPNGRGKVILSPGHSPMDWAALTRRSNLSGVETFRRVTPSELRQMTGRKGKPAWSSWQNKVYNITPYLPFHPGGESELMKAAGRDGTKLFMDVHPWVNWENMLESCLVGLMVPEDYGKGEGSSLEDMD